MRHAQEGERIAADPVGFLREVEARVSKMKQYSLVFYRQERGGLPPHMGPMEKIQALFRADPFSVKFTWLEESSPYYESVYVQGQNDNKLLVRERKGALPFLPPTVRAMDVMFPVKIGKSKNPITDFGLARLMKRTLLPFNDPKMARVMTIKYEGVVNLDPFNRPAYYLRIEHPKMPDMVYTRQDLYIDAKTLLPSGTDLYLPGDVLDVRYRYNKVDTNVKLTDADFRLSKNHPGSQPADNK